MFLIFNVGFLVASLLVYNVTDVTMSMRSYFNVAFYFNLGKDEPLGSDVKKQSAATAI